VDLSIQSLAPPHTQLQEVVEDTTTTYQNGVKIMEQVENQQAGIHSTRRRASQWSVIGMMMLDKLLEVVGVTRMMLRWKMDGRGLKLVGLVLVVAVGVEVAIGMEVEVLRGTTVVVEDEVMGTPSLHPLQRRAPMVIPTGSTSSSLLELGKDRSDQTWRCRDVCVGERRRAVDCYMSRRRS
jgi:hypothetical protein